jgi:hypothetical protein
MRRLSQSAFLAVVVLLAALPHLLADDAKPPVQVKLDVVVFTCPANALAETKLKCDTETPCVTERLSAAERAAIYDAVRRQKGAKLLAEPKIVAVTGRPCSFLSGGQVPVAVRHEGQATIGFRNVGTELNFLATVRADGKLHIKCEICLSDAKNEWRSAVENDLTAEQTLAVAQVLPGPEKQSEKKARLLLITPTILNDSLAAPAAAESQSARLKKIVGLMVEEYRAACDAHNAELAAKLARHALDLDPTCFHQTHASCPIPAPCPGVAAWPVVAVCPTPTVPPVKSAEPEPRCTVEPSEAEVLKTLPKAARESVEVVFEKMIDKIDAPRFFPLVGTAKLHHCQWKCTVYSADAKTNQRRCEVIYIDKDFLHSSSGEAVAVPESKPTETKVGRLWDKFLTRFVLVHPYSSDPNERMKQLLNDSQDLRDVREEWKRIWFQDHPSHMTPDRVHGGIW